MRGLLALALLAALGAQPQGGSTLDRLQANWQTLQDYSLTIVAHEVLDGHSEDSVLRYWFRKPAEAKLVIEEGARRGSVAIWHGGDRLTVYRRGWSFFKLSFDVHDPSVSSLRGNTILTPSLGPLLDCFVDHRQNVEESAGPILDGRGTTLLALTRNGYACSTDSPADRAVTRDLLYVARDPLFIVRRERYEGATLVERWELRDVQIDAGLGEDAFR